MLVVQYSMKYAEDDKPVIVRAYKEEEGLMRFTNQKTWARQISPKSLFILV